MTAATTGSLLATCLALALGSQVLAENQLMLMTGQQNGQTFVAPYAELAWRQWRLSPEQLGYAYDLGQWQFQSGLSWVYNDQANDDQLPLWFDLYQQATWQWLFLQYQQRLHHNLQQQGQSWQQELALGLPLGPVLMQGGYQLRWLSDAAQERHWPGEQGELEQAWVARGQWQLSPSWRAMGDYSHRWLESSRSDWALGVGYVF